MFLAFGIPGLKWMRQFTCTVLLLLPSVIMYVVGPLVEFMTHPASHRGSSLPTTWLLAMAAEQEGFYLRCFLGWSLKFDKLFRPRLRPSLWTLRLAFGVPQVHLHRQVGSKPQLPCAADRLSWGPPGSPGVVWACPCPAEYSHPG